MGGQWEKEEFDTHGGQEGKTYKERN